MKALARYQIILLGDQRHIGVNNLPTVIAQPCSGRESNPRPFDHESDTLTTTPPSHQLNYYVLLWNLFFLSQAAISNLVEQNITSHLNGSCRNFIIMQHIQVLAMQYLGMHD